MDLGIKQKKKGGKKKKNSGQLNPGVLNQQALSAGEKFLTPSIEYYKNVANQYKKTLSTLSINQPGSNKPDSAASSSKPLATINENSNGRNEQPYMMQHQKDMRSSMNNLHHRGDQEKGTGSGHMLPPQQLHNEYSTQSILKNAKTEKLMLDIEQYIVKTKKEFNHEVQAKEEINQYFGKMNECIDQIVDKVASSVNHHRKDFFDRFNGELYNIHSNYRELQESTNENLNKMKLKKEILDRQAERDWFKNECNKIDAKCHEKQDELYRFKDKHNEFLQEKKFLDEQILTARENKINLNRRKEELLEELNELKEGGQPDNQIQGFADNGANPSNTSRALQLLPQTRSPRRTDKDDPNYFENSVKKLKDYIAHLQKRNEIERKNALKKQIMSDKLEDSNYPFELIFHDSVLQIKEEIVERKHKTQRRGMNTSKSALSIRMGQEITKTPEDLQDHFQHKSIFNKFDLEIDHVKPTNFTESDKKRVVENFLGNVEVQYFIYGLLFPQSLMNMQAQQQSMQLDDNSQ
ncbi:UNKNOWN [Stylonychia lemnae]|uniref:Uncharacterized protein n=1 Tax=Stylonychia lemnae TaxID=5949 RepID=A0A078ATV4_STYLE|nr:UNKNOWN [Stylonychia lemnae]|eukprot:CDW85684.1 UNKNOWN [Stylonychia lemnae]